jgi:hypothetical protein
MAAPLLANCASAPDRALDRAPDRVKDACDQVKDVVNALPAKTPKETVIDQFVPKLDRELAAARGAADAFRAAKVDADLLTAWASMVNALQEVRDQWLATADPNRAPGSDVVLTLDLGEKKDQVDTALAALKAAAEKSGHAECGDPIRWQY